MEYSAFSFWFAFAQQCLLREMQWKSNKQTTNLLYRKATTRIDPTLFSWASQRELLSHVIHGETPGLAQSFRPKLKSKSSNWLSTSIQLKLNLGRQLPVFTWHELIHWLPPHSAPQGHWSGEREDTCDNFMFQFPERYFNARRNTQASRQWKKAGEQVWLNEHRFFASCLWPFVGTI